MMYVSIQPLWFFASKACLKQGITCMHYLQLAKLLLAGITQSQQRTSLHLSFTFTSFSILSSFFFCATSCPSFNSSTISWLSLSNPLWLYAAIQLSIFKKKPVSGDQSNAHPGLQLFNFFVFVHITNTFVNLLCRSCRLRSGTLFHTVVFPPFSPSIRGHPVASYTQRMPHYFSKFHYRKSCYLGEAIT